MEAHNVQTGGGIIDMNNDISISANRELKDGVFKLLFDNQENAAELYYALTGKECSPEEVQIFTLSTVISGKRQNDLAFVVRDEALVVGEHMSTPSTNMPARFLIYVGQLYDKWITGNDGGALIYGSSLYQIPTPELVVFYNGIASRPEKEILKLSTAFKKQADTSIFGSVEVEVPVYNINKGMGSGLFSKSEKLKHYSEFIAKIRELQTIYNDYTEAVGKAVEYCINNGILAEFLKKKRGVIVSILNMEYTEEVAVRVARNDGIKEGLIEAAKNMLKRNRPIDEIMEVTSLTRNEVESLSI